MRHRGRLWHRPWKTDTAVANGACSATQRRQIIRALERQRKQGRSERPTASRVRVCTRKDDGTRRDGARNCGYFATVDNRFVARYLCTVRRSRAIKRLCQTTTDVTRNCASAEFTAQSKPSRMAGPPPREQTRYETVVSIASRVTKRSPPPGRTSRGMIDKSSRGKSSNSARTQISSSYP